MTAVTLALELQGGRPRDSATSTRAAAGPPGSCQRGGSHRGRASPSGRGGANGATLCEGHPRWPCHKRAIHSGPERSRAGNHGQLRSSLGLQCSPPSQVTAAPDWLWEEGVGQSVERWATRCPRPGRRLPQAVEPRGSVTVGAGPGTTPLLPRTSFNYAAPWTVGCIERMDKARALALA